MLLTQVCPEEHAPQSSAPEQPFEVVPQEALIWAQVLGVQEACSHWWSMQVLPLGQPPQSIVPPQPSAASQQLALS